MVWMKFILVVIELFSKYVWLRPMEINRGHPLKWHFVMFYVKIVFWTKLERTKIRPKRVESLLKNYHIKHIFAQNTEVKANYAERVIKIIKTKIYRYPTYKIAYSYIDKLQWFANNYNNTLHSTIDIEPINVTPRIEEEIRGSTCLSREKRTGKPLSVTKQPYKFKLVKKYV